MNPIANIKKSSGKVLSALSYSANVKLTDSQLAMAKRVIDEHPSPTPTLHELLELWEEDVELQAFATAVRRVFLPK